jgi:hypothetical protein
MFRRTKPKDKMCERIELIFVHVTIEAARGIEFSAATRCTTIADGRGSGAYGECFREKDTSLMEVEVLVGDVVLQIANHLGFDRVSPCAPFVGVRGKSVESQ